MHRSILSSLLRLFAVGFLLTPSSLTSQVTSPVDRFGHEIGANYELVTYAELQSYWELLASESDRMVLDTIGYTEEGRPQLMAILTSPENHQDLDRSFHRIIPRPPLPNHARRLHCRRRSLTFPVLNYPIGDGKQRRFTRLVTVSSVDLPDW